MERILYTPNGRVGRNYDSRLTLKEITAKVRQYAKEKHPDYRFSVRMEDNNAIRVELKAGPVFPFADGNRKAINTPYISAYEKELDPDVYKVLEDITALVVSYNYDNSDAMIDYFETNFYYDIAISENYRVNETNNSETAAAFSGGCGVVSGGLEIMEYSDKALAVFGDTKAIKERLKEIGGRFNPVLRYNGEKRAGWIFSKKQENKLRAALQ